MSEEGTTIEYVGNPTAQKVEDRNLCDVALHCPWCGVVSRVDVPIFHKTRVGHGFQLFTMAVCKSRQCDRAAFLVVDDTHDQFTRFPRPFPTRVYPHAEAQYAPDGVPEPIAAEFREALECAWSGHFLGAALVGRRVLQAAARDILGGKRKDLYTEVDEIPDDRLNKALKDQATHVRLIGNDAAHVDPVEAEDVVDLLDFLREVLDALYVRPTRVAELQAKRDAAKAAKSAVKPTPAPNAKGKT